MSLLKRYVIMVVFLFPVILVLQVTGHKAAQAANLSFVNRPGWDYPVVVRNIDNSTGSSCQVPIFLNVDPSPNYWNVSGVVDDAAVPAFVVSFFVDGNLRGLATVPGQPDLPFYVINQGPFYNLAGRHTCGGFLDSFEQINESDETDNRWARQYIWRPYFIHPNTPVVRGAPPDPSGGRSSIPDGEPNYSNCDGLRFDTTPGDFHAITVIPDDLLERYIARLHPESMGVEDGFAADSASTDPYGDGLVAVVVRNLVPASAGTWDVGVRNATGGTCDYVIEHVTQDPVMDFGDSVIVTLGAGELVKLVPFDVSSGQTGYIYGEVAIDPAQGPLKVKLIADEVAYDLDFGYETDAIGIARDFETASQEGRYCLVFYRDPADSLPELQVGVEIDRSLPDLRPYIDSEDDFAALTVTPDPPTMGKGVKAPPDTLYGGVHSNYLAWRGLNWSNEWVYTPSMTRFFVDGSEVYDYVGDPLIAGFDIWGHGRQYSFGPVGGGRHTVSMHLNVLASFPELDHVNNFHSVQLCWSPAELPAGTAVIRPAPPVANAGQWNLVGIPYSNCDGVRLPSGIVPNERYNWWQGVSVASGAASDVDIHLFYALQGTQNGFKDMGLAYSLWPNPFVDFVLVNFRRTEYRPFDIGFVNDGGEEDFVAEHIGSTYLTSDPHGKFGPYFLAAGRMVDLWEFQLLPGLYAFRLDSKSRGVDWGMTLHPSDESFVSVADFVPNGRAWDHGTGQDEWFTVDIAQTGYYCLAVWKADNSQLNVLGTYELWIVPDASAVPEDEGLPARTSLIDAYPNPFNPCTTIGYDLDRPAPVTLTIYDMGGRVVRQLRTGGIEPGGHHEVVWNGQDESGLQVASGTYFYRLESGTFTETKSMTLVK